MGTQEANTKKRCLLRNLKLTVSCFLLWTCLSCYLPTSGNKSMQEKESIEKHNNVEKRDSARERIPTGTSFNHSSVAGGANTTMICSSLFIWQRKAIINTSNTTNTINTKIINTPPTPPTTSTPKWSTHLQHHQHHQHQHNLHQHNDYIIFFFSIYVSICINILLVNMKINWIRNP